METEASTVEVNEPGVVADEATTPGDALGVELAASKAYAEKLYADLQYARADIENVRKRAIKIADDRLSSSRRQLLAKFLPVLDNLQRAVSFGENADLRGGVAATLKAFEQLLASEGLTPVETVGKPFDPHVAEAVSTRETSEHDDDIVLDELQAGYRIGEELVRPALVVVAKRIEGAEASAQSE